MTTWAMCKGPPCAWQALSIRESETARAKHPAKVLTVTVDAVLDHPNAVILHPVPDSRIRPPGMSRRSESCDASV
jgi:hypothetical protein